MPDFSRMAKPSMWSVLVMAMILALMFLVDSVAGAQSPHGIKIQLGDFHLDGQGRTRSVPDTIPYVANFSDPDTLVPKRRRDMNGTSQDLPARRDGQLVEILRRGQVALQTVANLALGAAIVPDGLAIAPAGYHFVAVVINTAAPQWVPVKWRSADWAAACDGTQSPLCRRIIDPVAAMADCPSTERLHEMTEQIMSEFAEGYEGSANPGYYAQLMYQFCEQQPALCTDVHAHDHRRQKRLASAALLSLIVGGTTIYSQVKMDQLSKKVDALADTVDNMAGTMNTLQESVRELTVKGQHLTQLVTEGLSEVYTVIEKLRCSDFQELETLQMYTASQIYRNYLTTLMNSMHETASTGVISPHLLAVPQVRAIMENHPILQHSLVRHEPSLFYQYARAYPVRMNYQTMSFGFIIQVPHIRKADVLPLYRIYNVGFHQASSPTNRTVDPSMVYKVPLPEHAVLRGRSGLHPLNTKDCQRGLGLTYCETEALAVGEPPTSCLSLLTSVECPSCIHAGPCRDDIELEVGSHRTDEVATTLSGALVRSPIKTVHVYQDVPGAARAQALPVSPHGTYWIDYGNTTHFTVGDVLYSSPRRGDVRAITIFAMPMMNLSRGDIKIRLASLQHLSEIENSDLKINQLLNKVRPFPTKEPIVNRHDWLMYGSIAGAVAAFLILAIAGCIVARPDPFHVAFSARRDPPLGPSVEETSIYEVPTTACQRSPSIATLAPVHTPPPTYRSILDPAYANGVVKYTGCCQRPRSGAFCRTASQPDLLRESEPPPCGPSPKPPPSLETLPKSPPIGVEPVEISVMEVIPVEFAEAAPAKGTALRTKGKTPKVATASGLRVPSTMMDTPPAGGFAFSPGFECEGISALVDTGAGVSLIESSLATRTKATVQPLNTSLSSCVYTAEGNAVRITGYVQAILVIGNSVYPHRFFVRAPILGLRPKKPYDMIIGLDLLDKIGMFTVDFKGRRVLFKDPTSKTLYVYPLNPAVTGHRLVINPHVGKKWRMGDQPGLASPPSLASAKRSALADAPGVPAKVPTKKPVTKKDSQPKRPPPPAPPVPPRVGAHTAKAKAKATRASKAASKEVEESGQQSRSSQKALPTPPPTPPAAGSDSESSAESSEDENESPAEKAARIKRKALHQRAKELQKKYRKTVLQILETGPITDGEDEDDQVDLITLDPAYADSGASSEWDDNSDCLNDVGEEELAPG